MRPMALPTVLLLWAVLISTASSTNNAQFVWKPSTDWALEISCNDDSSCPFGFSCRNVAAADRPKCIKDQQNYNTPTHYSCTTMGSKTCNVICPAHSSLSTLCPWSNVSYYPTPTPCRSSPHKCLPSLIESSCGMTTPPIQCQEIVHNNNTNCSVGRAGPLCLACDEKNDFVTLGDKTCEQCSGGPNVLVAFLVLLALCFVFCKLKISILVYFLRKHKPVDSAEHKKQIKRANALAGMLKILLSFLQIILSMAKSFNNVPWPVSFSSIALVTLDWINVDVFTGMRGFGCALGASIALKPLEALILHLMFPLMITSACMVAFVVLKIGVKKLMKGTDAEKKNMIFMLWSTNCKVLIAVYIVLYPGLCMRLFNTFKCVEISGISYLEADYNVVCGGDLHNTQVVATVVGMILYILGIPGFMLAILYKNFPHLYDENSQEHHRTMYQLGSLYHQYEPKYWWFEVVQTVNKMLMTGAFGVVAMGQPPIQMVVVLLFSLVFMLIMLKCAPYVSDIDDRLNFLATLGFVFTGLAGLILTMDQQTLEPSFNSEMVGYFLLAFTSFVVIVHFMYVFHHILDCGRKSSSKSVSGEGDAVTKVMPIGDSK